MVAEQVISKNVADQAKAQAVPRFRKPLPILAPHAADQAIGTASPQLVVARLRPFATKLSGVIVRESGRSSIPRQI